MFSRKRRFYEKKSFYAAAVTALAAVLVFGLWFNGDIGSDPGSSVVDEQNVDGDVAAANAASSGAGDDRDAQISSTAQDDEPDVQTSGAEVIDQPLNEGYLVVEEDGYIRVYQVDSAGEKTLLRTSEILFDLLGSEDQKMFQLGVELQTEDQLMELLQDFES